MCEDQGGDQRGVGQSREEVIGDNNSMVQGSHQAQGGKVDGGDV